MTSLAPSNFATLFDSPRWVLLIDSVPSSLYTVDIVVSPMVRS